MVRSSADADWSHEIRYHVLLRQPEVRALIAHHAALAGKPMTVEKLIAGGVEMMDMGHGGDIAALAGILTWRLGRRMTARPKTRTEAIPFSPAHVMVALLCSLAQHGHRLLRTQQADDGCLFDAALRRSIFSGGGDLSVIVRRSDTGSAVEARIRIRGRQIDWNNKGRRLLNQLFADLRSIPSTFVAPNR